MKASLDPRPFTAFLCQRDGKLHEVACYHPECGWDPCSVFRVMMQAVGLGTSWS